MCGITGILQTPHASRSADLAAIGPMTARLRHRGPDADGFWSDRDAGVAFGHRRLSIIDLSDAGRQPMLSSDGRFVITFNGEIYNYKPLRQELECAGRRFIGNSDTEVLLGLIEKWGLRRPSSAAMVCSQSACGIAGTARCIWPAIEWGKSRSTSR